MRIHLLFEVVVGLVAGSLILGCSGTPEVVEADPQGGISGRGGGNGNGGVGGVEVGNGGSGIQVGKGGTGNNTAGTGSNPSCKTSCEVGDCGTIPDGCDSEIECGGCSAPETCGGGGEENKCGGTDACVPMTCDELSITCGKAGDGCGGEIDCWNDEAKADGDPHCPNPTQECVDGTCVDTATCTTRLTCDDYSAKDGLCGPVSDGCGATLECGFECSKTQICGAQEAGKCGVATCVPKTCEEMLRELPAKYCGFIADGCGGEIKNCATSCSGGDTCGGGGVSDVCGHGTVCVPKTVAECGTTNCGPISDGCSGTISCGTCTAPQTCGGGNEPGRCGAPACQPKSCEDLGATCGTIPNGCGQTLTCGTCGTGTICNANQCQDVVCKPKTAQEVCTGHCGPQSDGCGGTVQCGGCTAPNTCGGGGTPSVCGAPACTPRSCQTQDANCGPIGDGCGQILNCGSCTAPATCGGGGPSKCGVLTDPNCTGLCPNIVACSAGQETRLTGTVYAPNGTEPLYNALVYVPNAPLPPMTTGPSCGRCEDEDLGKPIAAALTGADGKFVLKNVPAGVSFPLVVKMGKWRRVVTIPAVTKCTNVNLTVDQTRLPRHMKDASAANIQFVNIPKTAMVTGKVDEMECVLRKIGVDDSEFTLPSGAGRIQLYRANGAYASCTRFRSDGKTCQRDYAQSAPLSDLFSSNRLDNYDLSIFDCEGDELDHDAYDNTLRNWADRGGRVFASHYSYTYLFHETSYKTTATWGGTQDGNGDATTGILDTGFPKGQAFNTWLGNVNAWDPTYGSGYIHIDDPRGYVKTVTNVSERFVYTDTSVKPKGTSINQQNAIQQYAFNTPVGASSANLCGRVLYSAFHVADASDNSNQIFPKHCSSGALTPQEKVLEFMIFDLSACVSVGDPPKPPTCTAKTCQQIGANCGQAADGCGGLLNCGTCAAPNSCGGGGVPNVCGTNCKQTTCGAQGANCGIIADGCGGTINCGTCTAPSICGGGGTANVCGVPSCTPRSCSSVGAQCGAISDGCGGTVNCGVCVDPATCGGGGTPNVCGAGSCNPKTCSSESAECGFIGDGCGGTVSCGTCPSGQTCGAGGPNKCGGGCAPRTCSAATADCGFVGDGCGGVLNCGTCSPPLICGGGGTPSKCGGSCSQRTCGQAGAECGGISDGCGGVLQCGTCPPGQTCGAAGANKCGAGSCTPKSCTQLGAECGAIGDGCGGILQCGACVAPESCGGAGVPNQCGQGTGGCVPRSCQQQNANCGPVSDGCGGLLDCGVCVAGETCGGAGTPSQCGAIR